MRLGQLCTQPRARTCCAAVEKTRQGVFENVIMEETDTREEEAYVSVAQLCVLSLAQTLTVRMVTRVEILIGLPSSKCFKYKGKTPIERI